MPPVTNYNIFTLSSESVVGISTTATVGLSTSAVNPVTVTMSTGLTISSVSVSTTPAIAGTTYNASRKGYTLYNQGTSAILVAYSTVAATTTYSLSLASGAYWEMPVPLSALPISVAVSTSLTGGTASAFISELS